MRRWDRRGLEGLPLKLLITSLLVALAAPAVLSGLEGFERSTARSQLTSEAARLACAVEEARAAGEGNRRAVTVSLPESLGRFSMSMDIGGGLGNATSLSIRCSCGGMAFSTLVLDDPPARVTSAGLSTLRLEGGEHRLTLECRQVEGRTAVVLAVV